MRKTHNTPTGQPPLTLANACFITSARTNAVEHLRETISEIEDVISDADLTEHFNESDLSWSEEIRPIVNHYHGLKAALTELTGEDESLSMEEMVTHQLSHRNKVAAWTTKAASLSIS